MTRRTKVISGALAAILVLGIAYFFWLRSSDTSTYYEYATYADLTGDPTTVAANVPGFVPRSAKRISGWYDVDFNVSALEFEFENTDHSSIARAFQRVTGQQQNLVERKIRGYKWKHEVPHTQELEAFLGHEEGTEYLILDRKNLTAYYVSES